MAKCRLCPATKMVKTEFEFACNIPIKNKGYNQMNRLSKGRLGMNPTQKRQLFNDNWDEMVRVWHEEGDYGVVTKFPIHISTWTQWKKKRGLVPQKDNRVTTNQWKKHQLPPPLGHKQYSPEDIENCLNFSKQPA